MSDHIEYKINLIGIEEAKQIVKWRYQDPYSIYNMDETDECLNELLNGSYYSVTDSQDNLIGYFCFGKSAQVPADNAFGAYSDDSYADIGLGIRPDLCGKGFGLGFLKAGIVFACREFSAEKFRLTVAGYNERAIKVYERAGFVKEISFERVSEKGSIAFWVMTL